MGPECSADEQPMVANPESGTLIIDGGIVVTMNAKREVLAPGYVVIRGESIAEVGSGRVSAPEGSTVIDATGCVVIPGLVNAHNHLDQAMYRGCLDELPQSRDHLLALARGLTYERARVAARASLLEQVQYGITTTHESHWTHFHPDSTDGVCDAILESGLRALVARSISDNQETHEDFREQASDVLNDLDRLSEKYDSDVMSIISEPTTLPRCTADTVVQMREWAVSRGKLWHVHLAQGREELEESHRVFGMGSVQYAKKLGVLGPEMLAAHCSGILDEEVPLLGEAGVRIAHCPAPVIRGGGVVPPIWELERLGATVAIATDGSATNNGQNPWEAMKLAVYMQRVRFAQRRLGSAEQALEGATIKAAKALGMDDRVGSIEVGKSGDVAVFALDDLSLAPARTPINNLVYSSSVNRARTVVARGEVLVSDGASTRLDAREVASELNAAQESLIAESGLQGAIRLTRTWPIVEA